MDDIGEVEVKEADQAAPNIKQKKKIQNSRYSNTSNIESSFDPEDAKSKTDSDINSLIGRADQALEKAIKYPITFQKKKGKNAENEGLEKNGSIVQKLYGKEAIGNLLDSNIELSDNTDNYKTTSEIEIVMTKANSALSKHKMKEVANDDSNIESVLGPEEENYKTNSDIENVINGANTALQKKGKKPIRAREQRNLESEEEMKEKKEKLQKSAKIKEQRKEEIKMESIESQKKEYVKLPRGGKNALESNKMQESGLFGSKVEIKKADECAPEVRPKPKQDKTKKDQT